MILAPGKSLNKEKYKIKYFIDKEHPFVISLNFISNEYNEDLVL